MIPFVCTVEREGVVALARRFAFMGALVCAFAGALSAPGYAQKRGGGGLTNNPPPELVRAEQEEMDFSALQTAPTADQKIKLGTQFLNNYAQSAHRQDVYTELVEAYYGMQNWTDFYGTADKAVAAYPDDVDVLVLVGWVIPHTYNPDDADSAMKLGRAESYEKHAIELVPSLHKPPTLTDQQFETAKTEKLTQAHSGLGLVYFRKENWDGSVKELQQATQGAASPDPTDLYALGFGLEQLSRYSEAAEAYDRCSAAPGVLQARCTDSAARAKSQIPPAK